MKLPTYDSLLLGIDQHVATITLNRPDKRNAFNDDVIRELTDVFQFCAAQDEVRVVVLTANGKAFCAGADLNWMRAMADYSHDENLADAGKLAQMLATIYHCPKPTVAAIQGDVYAGGDIVRGGATVILAMGDGRKAAAAMDADLKGKV